MSEYILSCCSCADLDREHFEKRNISYACFHYQLDGVDYQDDLGETISYDDFYKAMTEGADTRTSQINTAEYTAYFEQFLKAGKDVIHLTLSSGLSGSYNSALLAAEALSERYPDRKLTVIDSLCVASGEGLLMDNAADLRDAGMSYEDMCAWFKANRLKHHHWFFSTDLTFYVKGGRISKASGLIGGMLNICPLLNVNSEGKLIPREKIRTKRKVISTIVDRMEEHAEGGINYSGKVYISHSACYEDARKVADLVEERFKNMQGKVEIYSIGSTIGSHTGPGTIALFFVGDERTL